jgi:hypothetical protein
MAPLIANLRGQFAEFLNQRSPERLRLLVSPTCVSFSTVTMALAFRAFLGHPSSDFENLGSRSHFLIMQGHLTYGLLSKGSTDISNRALILRCRPSIVQTLHGGAGMLTCCPSSTPFGLD